MKRNMNKWLYSSIFLIASSLLLCSCEKMFTHEFNPSGNLEDKGKILVESILESGQDTIKIRSGIATALKNKHTVDARLLNMSLKINGEEIEIREDTGSPKEFINQKNFYALRTLRPDDVIELTADAPDIDPVQSEVRMGAALPEVKITKEIAWTDKDPWGYENSLNPGKNLCLKFTITLDEKPDASSFYGVQVLKKTNMVEYDDLYTLEKGDFPMSGRHYDLCGTYHEGDLQVFDSYYTNKEGKACFSVYVKNLRKEDLSESNPSLPEYQLIISRLSKEFYHSIETFNTVEGLWELGVGPHIHSYTNIEGGVGILGTKMDWTSEWIRNE